MSRVREWVARVRWRPVGGCWKWSGRRSERGYPFVVVGQARTALRYVQREMWRALVGELAAGEEVGAGCGVRWCVNPAHLARRVDGAWVVGLAEGAKLRAAEEAWQAGCGWPAWCRVDLGAWDAGADEPRLAEQRTTRRASWARTRPPKGGGYGVNEAWCFTCQRAVTPLHARFKRNRTVWNLVGECPDCGRTLYRALPKWAWPREEETA